MLSITYSHGLVKRTIWIAIVCGFGAGGRESDKIHMANLDEVCMEFITHLLTLLEVSIWKIDTKQNIPLSVSWTLVTHIQS